MSLEALRFNEPYNVQGSMGRLGAPLCVECKRIYAPMPQGRQSLAHAGQTPKLTLKSQIRKLTLMHNGPNPSKDIRPNPRKDLCPNLNKEFSSNQSNKHCSKRISNRTDLMSLIACRFNGSIRRASLC